MKEGKLQGAVINGIRTDLPTHAKDLDAHTKNFLEELRTGVYLGPLAVTSTTGVLSMSADILYAMPLFVARAITIDRMTINVTTADAGQVVRLGIYGNGTNLYPGALLLDASTVSTTATGHKEITGLSQAIPKGLYWVVALSDGTPIIRALGASDFLFSLLGQWSSDADYANCSWSVSQAYGALPATFTGGGAAAPNTAPKILLRIASLD